jgi:dienelactone hydrolase
LILVLIVYSTSNSQTLDNLAGDWHVNANGSRLTLSIARQGTKHVAYVSADGDECSQRTDNVTWDAETGQLEFRRPLGGVAQWYKVTIADGVMVGRFANVSKDDKPALPAYKYHLTGWSHDYFNQGVVPVVFDILANQRSRGRLRIDRSPEGRLIGRLKFYALDNSVWEYPEEEITVTHWDGDNIAFTRGTQSYTGTVEGRDISGVFTSGGAVAPWRGARAEVLTYGIAPKTLEERAAWQERTRRHLYRLMMAGNPAPLSVTVEVIRDNLPPITSTQYPTRDDDPDAHPQNYRLAELRLTYTLPNWLGSAPVTRVSHAYLAKPTSPPPGGLARYPLVIGVNGHVGSAYQVMTPGAQCWYGDAFARRGYMVLAVDIGHRPAIDLVQFGSTSDLSSYLGYPGSAIADDPANGNDYHPSIKPTKPANYTDAEWAYYTDWEEDGERVWDVMRAIDYAVSRPDVDPQRIAVTGLSMGGEIASYVGALDPRVAMSIPAGYSPDLNVFKYLGEHRCWNWAFADIREYIDHSDLFALTAPRPLIVETGARDIGFSIFPQAQSLLPSVPLGSAPFAGDKQVMRRARAAYGAGPLFHYLHPLAHEYQTGVAGGGLRYATVIEPQAIGDLLWQTNDDTATDGRTLFDYVAYFLNF